MLVEDLVNLKLDNGRYLVKSKLGEGGMGTVYLGHDTRLDSSVVVKVPHQNMLADSGFRDRFQREIQSLVRLMHPHIVKVIDVGEYEELPFAVMQYLGGGSLVDLSCQSDAISQLGDWLMPIAKALDFIHKKNYIHRDVKPANILFDDAGNAFLGDFGIAKVAEESDKQARRKPLTQPGIAMGTPEYMAPELCDGRAINEKVDQYALGVTVYEFLAGQCPLVGPTPLATILMHKTHQPDPLHIAKPGISKAVGDVVAQAMSKDPSGRFENCVAFAKALLKLDIVRQIPDIKSPSTGTFSSIHDETTMRDTSGLLIEVEDESGNDLDNTVEEAFAPGLLVEVVDTDEEQSSQSPAAKRSDPLEQSKSPTEENQKHSSEASSPESKSESDPPSCQMTGSERKDANHDLDSANLLVEVDTIDLENQIQASSNIAGDSGPSSAPEIPAVPPPIRADNHRKGKKRESTGMPSNSLAASKRSIPPLKSPAQPRKDPCPNCGKSLLVPDSMVGKTVDCPFCHQTLLVKNFGLKELSE